MTPPFRKTLRHAPDGMAALALAAALASAGTAPADSGGRLALPPDEVPYVAAEGTGGFLLVGWGASPSDDTHAYALGQVVSTYGWESALEPGPALPGVDAGTVSLPPDPVTFETVGIACGEFHTVLLKRNGTVTVRGWNRAGQANVPAGLADVVAVACGADHNLALRADGSVVAWGWNVEMQASVPPGLPPAVAVAAGAAHSLALGRDGRVTAWGRNRLGQADVPPGLTNAVAIAAGAAHSVALRRDGSPVVWGGHDDDLREIPHPARDLVAISAGARFTAGLRSDGRVVVWGDDEDGLMQPPAGLGDVVAIAAGNYHVMALRRDGSVAVWGATEYGATAPPEGLRGVGAIAAGGFHCQVLVQTSPYLDDVRSLGGRVRCRVNLPAGRRYVVERSRDLREWLPGAERTALPGAYDLEWPVGADGAGFYRIQPLWGSDVRGFPDL